MNLFKRTIKRGLTEAIFSLTNHDHHVSELAFNISSEDLNVSNLIHLAGLRIQPHTVSKGLIDMHLNIVTTKEQQVKFTSPN